MAVPLPLPAAQNGLGLVTLAELRVELKHFAECDLRNELTQALLRVEEGLQKNFKRPQELPPDTALCGASAAALNGPSVTTAMGMPSCQPSPRGTSGAPDPAQPAPSASDCAVLPTTPSTTLETGPSGAVQMTDGVPLSDVVGTQVPEASTSGAHSNGHHDASSCKDVEVEQPSGILTPSAEESVFGDEHARRTSRHSTVTTNDAITSEKQSDFNAQMPRQVSSGSNRMSSPKASRQGLARLSAHPSVLKHNFDDAMCKRASKMGLRASLQYKPQEIAVATRWQDVKATSVGHCKSFQRFLNRVVRSQEFEWLMTFFIVCNAISTGVQTNYLAQARSDHLPRSYRALEVSFAVIFTAEVVFRWSLEGRKFLCGDGWVWNVFDTVVVALQLAEELLTFVALGGATRWIRAVRILRLARILRIVRILRLVSELRIIISSILGSLRSVCWTLVLLLMMIYSLSLYLTQLVTNHALDMHERGEPFDESMAQYFGDVGSSVATLFESITGGVDWYTYCRPLGREVSYIGGAVIFCYISFTLFAVLNSVTGVFVQSASRTASKDHETFVLELASRALQRAELDTEGFINESKFEDTLRSRELELYLEALDFETSDAQALFQLLDSDGLGRVSFVDFLNGCFRLRGPCKAMEFAAFLLVFYDFQTKQERRWAQVERNLAAIFSLMRPLEAKPTAAFGSPAPPAVEPQEPLVSHTPRAAPPGFKLNTGHRLRPQVSSGSHAESSSPAMYISRVAAGTGSGLAASRFALGKPRPSAHEVSDMDPVIAELASKVSDSRPPFEWVGDGASVPQPRSFERGPPSCENPDEKQRQVLQGSPTVSSRIQNLHGG